jgi:flagellar hook protein FlgE
MNNSFYTAVSGVKTQQFGIDTWGNNISNVNTVGYKFSNPEFKSLMSAATNGPAMQGFNDVGLGSTAQTTALNFSEGSLENTENALDLALAGKGFFGVKKGGDSTTNYFTRAGNFTTDANGSLVTQGGDFVLGQMSKGVTINKDGSASVGMNNVDTIISDPGAQTTLTLPKLLTHPGRPGKDAVTASAPPFEVIIKRDATSGVPPPVKMAYYIPKDTIPTAHVLDSSGKEISTLYILNQWKGEHEYTWNGKQTIDASGKPIPDALQDFAPDGKYIVRIDYIDQAAVNAVPKGSVTQYNVDGNGKIIASFTNGEASCVGQIPVFHFQNDQGLSKDGENLYKPTDNSGEAIFYKTNKKPADYYYLDTAGQRVLMNVKPGDGTYEPGSQILSNKLETSNVSLAEALTQLMVTQKAFDANAKCITTSDQMIQKALSLKRG